MTSALEIMPVLVNDVSVAWELVHGTTVSVEWEDVWIKDLG
jgi:hypothetical protein